MICRQLFVITATVFIAQSSIVLKWIPRSDPFATNAVAMLGGGSVLLGPSVVGRLERESAQRSS